MDTAREPAPATIEKDRLSAAHRRSRASYYRTVLEKEDALYIARLMKIPDDWEAYEQNGHGALPLPPDQKNRLSLIKTAKSQELRFETEYLDAMLAVENSLIACLSHITMNEDEIRETINTLGEIIDEAPAHTGDFKHLLLNLARRAVSDLYYLMAFHVKYYKHKEFFFEEDFLPFCQYAIGLLHERLKYPRLTSGIAYHFTQIRPFFIASSNRWGWRLDERAFKVFLDREREQTTALVGEITRGVVPAVDLAAHLKADYEFIHAYYCGGEGLMARYEFINATLQQKHDEGRVSAQCIAGFRDILGRLADLAGYFQERGLRGFGPALLPYGELIDYLMHATKIIEFHLLRAAHYEELKALRTDLFKGIEAAYDHLHRGDARTQ